MQCPLVLTSTSSSRAKIFGATSCSCFRQLYLFTLVHNLPIQSSLGVSLGLFYPSNSKLYISSSKWLLPDRKEVETYICRNSVTNPDDVRRSYDPIVCDSSICTYVIPVLFMVFSCELEYSDISQHWQSPLHLFKRLYMLPNTVKLW